MPKQGATSSRPAFEEKIGEDRQKKREKEREKEITEREKERRKDRMSPESGRE